MSGDLQLEAMKGYFQSMFRETGLGKTEPASGKDSAEAGEARAPLLSGSLFRRLRLRAL